MNNQYSVITAEKLSYIVIYSTLILVAIIMCFPYIWMVITSFKPKAEIFAYPPSLVPRAITFEHYVTVFSQTSFFRYYCNSLLIAGTVTSVNLFFCSLAGYAFARLEFYGRNFIFILLIGTMMIPIHVKLIPLFIIAKSFPLAGGNNILGSGGTGLINTYPGLMIPYLMSIFGVFLVRQFFMTVPEEIREAAKIDGAGEFLIYRRIMLPLSKPVLATFSIFMFTTIWDDFLWPLVITTSDKMRTVQLGLQIFQSQFSADWGPLMAATIVITVPVLLIFVAGQKYFIQGVTTTGMKG